METQIVPKFISGWVRTKEGTSQCPRHLKVRYRRKAFVLPSSSVDLTTSSVRNWLRVPWPGAFEIPLVAKRLAENGAYHAIICLGAVIRGSTPHFDYVAAEVSKGIAAVALESKIPVTFGVLTTDNLEQAIERAGTKSGNKGWDAAMAAMEMVNLFAELG